MAGMCTFFLNVVNISFWVIENRFVFHVIVWIRFCVVVVGRSGCLTLFPTCHYEDHAHTHKITRLQVRQETDSLRLVATLPHEYQTKNAKYINICH